MDDFSWNRRSKQLSFDADAGIRSAIKTQYYIDDEYGASGDDHGLEFWFYRFKAMYWIKNRKKASRYADAHEQRLKKQKRSGRKMNFYEMFGIPEPELDDDD